MTFTEAIGSQAEYIEYKYARPLYGTKIHKYLIILI